MTRRIHGSPGAISGLPSTENLLILHCYPLHLKHSSIKQIQPDLVPNLRYFHLGSSPSLADIDGLTHHTNLEWLGTENLKRITDFSAVSRLRSLVGLGINGSMWTTQRIDSLRPLQDLHGLRFLSIINARVTDKSLRPLHGLKQLQTLQRALWWSKEEVDQLHEANPHLRNAAEPNEGPESR